MSRNLVLSLFLPLVVVACAEPQKPIELQEETETDGKAANDGEAPKAKAAGSKATGPTAPVAKAVHESDGPSEPEPEPDPEFVELCDHQKQFRNDKLDDKKWQKLCVAMMSLERATLGPRWPAFKTCIMESSGLKIAEDCERKVKNG